MTPKTCIRLALLSTLLLTAGCGTLGSSRTRNTIYDTNMRVRKLDENLGASVNKLTETTATLMARVNESDAQMRQLQTLTEENQSKLESLSKDVSELKGSIYKRMGLSVSPGMSAGVTVEPPARTPAPGAPMTPAAPESAMPAPSVSAPMSGVPSTTAPATVATPATPAGPATAGGGDGTALYQSAQKTWESGDWAQALQRFDEFLQKYPSHESSGNAQFWKAACLLNLNKNQEASQEFEKVRANYPTSNKVPMAMRSEAVALSRLGQVDQATKLLQDVVANYPTSPAAEQAKKDLEKLKGPSAAR